MAFDKVIYYVNMKDKIIYNYYLTYLHIFKILLTDY
jgi:hypothetical protein